MKLVISDNERELDVLSNPDIRLLQDGLEMPLVARELTYAESADSDGRRRIRSRNQNAEGRIGLHISGTSDSHFWNNVDNVVELVESAHRNKGSIVYEPPGGTAVAYDIESITVTGLPQPGIELQNRRQNAEITFEVQPYGRLEPVQLIAGGTLDGPIDYVTVEDVPGQVMAPASLTLTEVSSEGRYFIELGIQNNFDPTNPEPILLTAGSMADADETLLAVGGTAGTASRPGSTYTNLGGTAYTIRQTLTTTASVIAKSGPLPHTGLWKIRARVQPSEDNVRVRLAWRSGLGVYTKEPWRVIDNDDQWFDIDLATVPIPSGSPGTPFEIQIEAASNTGNATLDLDTVSIIPADIYARFRGQPTTSVVVLNPGRTITVTDTEALALSASASWTARSAAEANAWQSITYGDGTFAAVSQNGTNRVMTSTDASSWTARSASEANLWRSVTHGNGTFVAVSSDGTNRVMTSTNGTSWTAQSAAEANQWQSITYGDGTFVAVSNTGTNRVMTSTNATSWTARSASEANDWRSVTYGNGLFVAVAASGTNRVMTSTDGTSWTARVAPEANAWQSITYGDGTFVAVALTGTNRVMTSTDGISWTARVAPEANAWQSITYGDGTFVAVSNTGTNRVMTSTDGITWTGRLASEANGWRSVTYGDGTFVAVAVDGTSRIMTSTGFISESFNQRVPIVEGSYPILPPSTRSDQKSRIVVRARRQDSQAGSIDAGLTDDLLVDLTVTPRVLLR